MNTTLNAEDKVLNFVKKIFTKAVDFDDYEDLLKKMNESQAESDGIIKDLTTANEQLNKISEANQAEIIKLNQLVAAKDKDIKVHISANEIANEKIRKLTAENEALAKENKEIKEGLSKIEQVADNLKLELQEKVEEINSLNDLLAKAEEAKANYINEINGLKEKIESLTNIGDILPFNTSEVEAPVANAVTEKFEKIGIKFTAEEVETAFQLDKDGKSVSEIAKQLDTSDRTIKNMITGKTYKQYGLYDKYKK